MILLLLNISYNYYAKYNQIVCQWMYIVIYSVGISQKKIDTNPSMGIGLNPNLNIEDEYI